MSPHTRLSLALVGALVLWLPTLMAVVHGDLDLLGAALRFAVAFAVLHVGLAVLAHLWHGYRAQADGPLTDTGTPPPRQA